MTTAGGFDAPTKDDALGRGPFAADVARIATGSPALWSVRIGVYGRWGTGKTSVLMMVQEMVEAEDHRAVWFNPWGYDTIDQMWAGFVEQVFGALGEWGINATGAKAAALKASSQKLVGIAKGLLPMMGPVLGVAEVADPTAAVATAAAEVAVAGASPFLDRWLRVGRDDLKGVVDSLDGKRVVVLIDDVDRADPKLLPKMFHAVKELLDLPGFSFVLALDPEVVGPVLRRHHDGFGIEFLEKVIDFPKWLPEPSREHLWSVTNRDINRYCGFLDADMVRRNFHLFPSNPRRLRMFIRQLWSLEQQVLRHNSDEVDQAALVLVHLLKVLWPKLASKVLSSDEFLEQLAMMKFFGSRNDRTDKVVDQITQMCKQVLGADSPDVPRAAELLRVVGESWQLLQPSHVRYLADLTERPHAVTWGEFDTFLAAWDKTGAALATWTEDHARAQSQQVERVRSELFDSAVRRIGFCCDRAADGPEEEALSDRMAEAGICIDLLAALWDLDPGVRTAAAFGQALTTFAKWTHFRNHDAYRRQRQRERELVLAMAMSAHDRDLSGFSEWVSRSPVYDLPTLDRPHAAQLFDEVRGLLEPRLAATCLELFHSPQGVRQTTRSRDARSLQAILYDGGGPLWQGLRTQAIATLNKAAGSAVVRQNVVDLLYEITTDPASTAGVGAAGAAEVRAILADTELVSALWNSACSRAPNPRHFSSLAKVRAKLQHLAGAQFEAPPWWARISAELDAVADPDSGAEE